MRKINIKSVSKILFVFTFLISGILISSNSSAASRSLSSRDFISINQGGVNGYNVGFALSGDIFNNASSIVIKLYSGNTLLQTNTATAGKITGNEFLTPFDVNGIFDYQKDGYFTNKRESEYGKTLKPTKVIAIVTMKDGEVLTTTNSNLDIKLSGSVLGQNRFNFTQKMKIGSKGNEVVELQKFLNANGFDCGTADGIFGPKTNGALVLFQISKNLDGDGIVGPITRSALNK